MIPLAQKETELAPGDIVKYYDHGVMVMRGSFGIVIATYVKSQSSASGATVPYRVVDVLWS